MALPLHATHNRAGEITLSQLDELTYQINYEASVRLAENNS